MGPAVGLSLAGIDDHEYKQDVGRDPLGRAGVSAQLELHLAGVFGVVRDGARLADGSLRSRKARTLLKLLAVERARLVSVDRITEVLWDGDPPAAPAQHVATLVSRLRRILGSEMIRGGRQGYQLAGKAGDHDRPGRGGPADRPCGAEAGDDARGGGRGG